MNDEELIKYSKHILLKDIDISGQENIINSKILIIGCGGLGNIIAPCLVANGIGKIGLVDNDVIELSNLSRQTCFNKSNIGQKKIQVLGKKLKKLNELSEIILIDDTINENNADMIFEKFDIILDCSDNFLTKKLSNEVALKLKKTFIFISAINFIGYFAVFNFNKNYHAGCLNCIFPNKDYIKINCLQSGVFSATVNLISSIAINETLKIAGNFGIIQKKFIILNSLDLSIKYIDLTFNPFCDICKKY